MTIASLLRYSLRAHASRTALIAEDRRIAYADLDASSDRVAAALAAGGVAPGDRIACLLANCPELVLLYLACLKSGAVAVPLNLRFAGPELAYAIAHSGACRVVAHADLYGTLAAQRRDLTGVTDWFVVGGPGLPAGTRSFSELLAPTTGPLGRSAPAPDAPAAILYTSGTTARPKGVVHTQGSLGATVGHYIEAAGLGPDDGLCGMLPMAHIFGLTLQLLAPLCAGAWVALVPRFEPGAVLAALAAHPITHLYGLPTMFAAMVNHPDAAGVATPKLRYCLAGGDALPQALSERMEALFGVAIHQGCGMTEVVPYALNRPGVENRSGSIGPPSRGMTLRVVDASRRELEVGEPGEVEVRSEALMAGYWRDPEATAAAIRDGWLSTGDIAYRDAEGWYWFVGRAKEIIVRGGSNVSPLEVEAALASHPAVREAAAVGVPDPELGERVRAFVSFRPGCTVSEEVLKAWAGERIAAYKVPESIVVLDELPKGPTGKVQRRALRTWTPARQAA